MKGCMIVLGIVAVLFVGLIVSVATYNPGHPTAAHAARHAPELSPQGLCDRYKATLIDATSAITEVVGHLDCRASGGGYHVDVTILDSAWTQLDYDQRLGLAKSLWQACVKTAHPETADRCHVKLIGEQGEPLGGSNDFIGSSIDVNKD